MQKGHQAPRLSVGDPESRCDGVGGYRKTRTNETGILHVGIRKNSKLKQGFCYRYEYRTKTKTYEFHSIDIRKLEQRVKNEGLGWVIVDKEKAEQTYGC